MIDKEKQIIDGKEAEKKLKGLFKKTVKATKQQDIHEHWDTQVEIGGKMLKIDVKALKRDNRLDSEPNENIHWVEIRNVRGNKGWLYGESDLIAFETSDYFVLVGTLKLRKFLEKKVGYTPETISDITISKTKNLYEPYGRYGRKDIIVKVKTMDLMHIKYLSIKK
jgi:hypothetical protein